jgi:hypothetical protein
MLSASVAYVHNETCVNLSVSDKNGDVAGRTSVILFHGDAEACPELQCCWMPYQKKQAERHAAEDKPEAAQQEHEQS